MYIKETLLCCLVLCATLFTGCSDDEKAPILDEKQGEVTFKFVRNTVYSVSTLEEMARLKVTLEKDGKQIVLQTVDLTGNEEELTSETLAVEEGAYKVVKYVAYNNKGAQIQEAYVDEDNEITITHGEMSTFYFPISIRFVYVNNQLRNMLFGLCAEVLGPDSTAWPKTWRIENEDLLTWENLEFEVDDYGSILYLANITFDNKTFPGMKKLPEVIASFATIEGIHIVDIPEFEELPDNMDESALKSIVIMNTGFKAFPKNFEKMKNLYSLSVINSKLTELPERLAELPVISAVELSGNEIAEFPAALAEKWQKLVYLRMNNTKLASLPSNIFSMSYVSTFDFCDNPNLASLPEVRGEGVRMGGLFLDRCGFTSIPKIAQGRMLTLSLAENKITSVTADELNALSTKLETLILSGNKIGSFPKMEQTSPKRDLMMLSLDDCGLTEIPDLSNLENLRSLSLAKNNITTVGDGVFTNNKYLSILNLSDNAGLKTFSNNAGIYLRHQSVEVGNEIKEDDRPYYLHCVDVDNCPALQWEVPGTWCCIENFEVTNKEDLKLPLRNVIVYNRNSPGVTRQACPTCGKSSYDFPMSFEELMESIKK